MTSRFRIVALPAIFASAVLLVLTLSSSAQQPVLPAAPAKVTVMLSQSTATGGSATVAKNTSNLPYVAIHVYGTAGTNTNSWKTQSSLDGVNWTDVETVRANTDSTGVILYGAAQPYMRIYVNSISAGKLSAIAYFTQAPPTAWVVSPTATP